MSTKYVVEVSAAGAKQAESDLNKVAAAEQKVATASEPKAGAGFDAVAKGAKSAAQAATTASSQIVQSQKNIEVSDRALQAAEEKLALARSKRQFQKRLGVSAEEAEALARARLGEKREQRGEARLGPLGQLGDLFGGGGQNIGMVGRLSIGAGLAITMAESVGALRKELRLFGEAQNEVSRSFSRGMFGADAPQLLSNIEGMAVQMRAANKQLQEQITPQFGESPMAWAKSKVDKMWTAVGVTDDPAKVAAEQAKFQSQLMDEAAAKAVRLGEMTAQAAELAAAGFTKEAEALQRNIALQRELENITANAGLNHEQKITLGKIAMRNADAQEAAITRQQQAEDLKREQEGAAAGRNAAVAQQVAALTLSGHEAEAAALQRAADAREKIIGIVQQQLPLEATIAQIIGVQTSYALARPKAEKDSSDALKESLRVMSQQADIAELTAQQRGWEAQQLQHRATLEQQLFQIEHDAALTGAQREQKRAATINNYLRQEAAWNATRERAERQFLEDAAAENAILRERVRGHEDLAAAMQIERDLAHEIADIEADPNLTPEAKAKAIREAREQNRLQRLGEGRDKFNEAFDEKQRRKDMTPAEQAREAEGEKLWRQRERAGIAQLVEKERTRRANAGQGFSDEEKKAFRDDLIDARSKSIEDYRRKLEGGGKPDPAKDIERIRDRSKKDEPKREHMEPVGHMNLKDDHMKPFPGQKPIGSPLAPVAPAAAAAQVPDLSGMTSAVQSASSGLQAQVTAAIAALQGLPAALSALAPAISNMKANLEGRISALESDLSS